MSGETEENHKKPQSEQLVSGQIFKHRTTQIHRRNANHLAMTLVNFTTAKTNTVKAAISGTG
jgi:hypothetical protein